MPVADYKTYCTMLDRARAGRYALPAVNVTPLTTANAILRGLTESKADGIIQISTGGGAFASGSSVKDMALGATSIAEHVHRAAERYPVYVALHTDHCLKDKLDKFVLPLVEETEKRRAAGRPNLSSSSRIRYVTGCRRCTSMAFGSISPARLLENCGKWIVSARSSISFTRTRFSQR
jgi:fructose-bisphosphate aldolase, class II